MADDLTPTPQPSPAIQAQPSLPATEARPAEGVTTAPAAAPPPVPALSWRDSGRRLLRSLMYTVLSGVVGGLFGLAAGLLLAFVFYLRDWQDSNTLLLAIGGGVIAGVCFAGSITRRLGLTRHSIQGTKIGEEARQFARWLAGLALLLVCGWGGIALAAFVGHQFGVSEWQVVVTAASVVSLGLLLVLERHFWFSRFVGLRIPPGGRPWGSALFFWFTGVPGLLWRSTGPAPVDATPTAGGPAPEEPAAPDGVRELVETVIFVIVLVLMLKSFDAEAFVIPTGSMAETLLGYQKWVTCPDCGYRFPVNCSQQVDPTDPPAVWVGGCTCPNCRQHIRFIPHKDDYLLGVIPLSRTYLDPIGKEQRPPPAGLDEIADPDWGSGDRVLVSKFAYDLTERPPDRLDVVVFKYPGDGNLRARDAFPRTGPFKDGTPMNYIKRLVGLPGETIAVHGGDLYVLAPDKGLQYDDLQGVTDPVQRDDLTRQLWQTRFLHNNDPQALARFQAGDFQILRKPPATLLATRRIVYDDDHPARDLADLQPPRWADRGSGAGWASDGKNGFRLAPPSAGEEHWLVYHHLLRDDKLEFDARRAKLKEMLKDARLRAEVQEKMKNVLRQESLPEREVERQADPDRLLEDNPSSDLREVRDAYLPARDQALAELREAYGKEKPQLITDFMGYNTAEPGRGASGVNWVGDLILECDVQADQAQGGLTLELCRGVDRFQARFDLATGECKLWRLGEETPLAAQTTGLKGGGKHAVRFANVDQRLTVWVDGALPFGDGVAYPPPAQEGATDNDLQPASVGLKEVGGAVSGLRLYRDTYYTTAMGGDPAAPDADADVKFADAATLEKLRELPTLTMYVQPGHYLCMGDNSPQSSDGRLWGLVPQRLLLGKALDVYYPFDRFGRIR